MFPAWRRPRPKTTAPTRFAEKLKRLRKEQGWSQDDLGQQAGMHGRHIGKFEIGRVMPNAETVVKIASVLGVSIDYLLLDGGADDGAAMASLRDKQLLRQFEAVEKMSDEDKHIIASLIDAYIKKHRLEELLRQ